MVWGLAGREDSVARFNGERGLNSGLIIKQYSTLSSTGCSRCVAGVSEAQTKICRASLKQRQSNSVLLRRVCTPNQCIINKSHTNLAC